MARILSASWRPLGHRRDTTAMTTLVLASVGGAGCLPAGVAREQALLTRRSPASMTPRQRRAQIALSSSLENRVDLRQMPKLRESDSRG